MQNRNYLMLPLVLLTCSYAWAQNTGAQATPQTENAAPAAIGNPGTSGTNLSRRQPGNRRSGSAGLRGGNSSATQKLPPAPAANASVSVIGDSDGDGVLDRSGKSLDSAALPGVAMLHNALGIATGTLIHVRVGQAIDSGHAHNGDTVRGVLDAPLGKVPTGVPVTMTVVAASAAGQLTSNGMLSLQVISVNGEQVLSEVITAEGKEGQKVLADDAPARGTEAIFTPDQPITLPAA